MKKKILFIGLIVIVVLNVVIVIKSGFEDNNINNLKDKKVILIGDSLSLPGRWTTEFVSLCDCNGEIYGNGSAGFVVGGKTKPYKGLNFIEMLNVIIDTKTKKEKNSIDYIICGGGINDALNDFTAEEVKDNVKEFINLAKENFPNAKIVVFPIHTFKNISKSSHEKYYEIFNTASELGVMTTKDFIWWTIADRSFDSGDKVHLTDEGYKVLGGKILSFINGAGNINERNLDYTLAKDVAGNVNLSIKDNVVHLQGVLTYDGKTYKNLELIEMSSLYTVNKQFPVVVEVNEKTFIDSLIIEDGTIKLSSADNYRNPTIYLNTTWEVGINYEIK